MSLCLVWLPLSALAEDQPSPLPLASKHIWTGDPDRMMVVESHKAAVWADIFPYNRVHEQIAVNTGGGIC